MQNDETTCPRPAHPPKEELVQVNSSPPAPPHRQCLSSPALDTQRAWCHVLVAVLVPVSQTPNRSPTTTMGHGATQDGPQSLISDRHLEWDGVSDSSCEMYSPASFIISVSFEGLDALLFPGSGQPGPEVRNRERPGHKTLSPLPEFGPELPTVVCLEEYWCYFPPTPEDGMGGLLSSFCHAPPTPLSDEAHQY